MPKPEEEKKEAEKETSEVTEREDGSVEVAVKDEEAAEQQTQEEKVEEKKEPAKEQDSFKNKVYAQDRIISKLQREIDLLRQERTAPPPKAQEQQDDLDKLAQTDWKAAVRKVALEEAKKLRDEENQRISELRVAEQQTQRLEQNTSTVVSRHPELNDAGSEKYQVFQAILDKHPDWRMSPDGPLLTMYEMENELRAKGYDIDGTIKKAAEAEGERLVRASASSLAPSRTAPLANKIVLTKDQRDFCDQNGVSYEDYARTLRKAGDKAGVEA